MAKQTFTTGQVLTAAQMTSLQQTAMLGGAASAKTASFTLVAADAGTAISMSNASATTITVNTALFAAGDTVQITNLGAGVCTITAGTATVNTAASLALAQYESGTLDFTSTSAAIFIKGAGASAASGSLTLISTTAMTSGSAITLSAIPGTYNSLYFTITSWRASAGANIRLTFNGAASANDYVDVPADQTDLNFGATFLQLTTAQNSSTTNSFVRGNLPNYSDSTSWKILESTAIGNDDGTNTNVRGFFGHVGAKDVTDAITSLVFTLNTGTFAAGTLKLYGVN